MTNGQMLSQQEIDSLLRGSEDEDSRTVSWQEEFRMEEYLDAIEQDALGEIGNISFGSSATALSTLLNQKVEITTPSVSIIERKLLREEFPHPYVAIQVHYTCGFSGTNLMVIKQDDAGIIADLMLGGDGTSPAATLEDIHLSAVQEAMNQMMGSAATSMSTIFSKKVDISPPSINLMDLNMGEGEDAIPPANLLVKSSFRLRIGDLIDSNIMQLLPVEFAKELVDQLFSGTADADEQLQLENQPMRTVTDHDDKESGGGQKVQPTNAYRDNETIVYQSLQQQNDASEDRKPVNVQPAQFSSFQQSNLQETESNNMNMLLDIPLQVTVELGRTNRTVKDILELSSGSIVELDKLAGEPVDILVNKRLIAKGEVVVIDENFGVRVTDILSQSDRIKKLR
ncbi:MAG: flagellar motor switch phosphatase FliY [Bacillus sp. (in: firmicutes)]